MTAPVDTPVDTPYEALEPAVETVTDLYEAVVGSLPLVGVAFLVGAVGLVAASYLTTLFGRTLGRTQVDRTAVGLLTQLARVLAFVGVLLLALTIAGVPVGPALAGLGLAGLALAFALQTILENLVAGLILLIRKPFRGGDQIQVTDYEGTVQDLDLRVTRLVTYDGELVLIPNVDVYTNPLINFTRRGTRRTMATIGIDYRDDHDHARDVILAAVRAAEGVLATPAPEVLLHELGDSSVDFEIAFWTLPDMRSVRHARHAVLSGAKRAVEEAGLTIPWPIRTLVVDGPVEVDGGR